MDRLLRKANIWDLHIHTPLGTPTQKNYGNDSTEEFVDKILSIYENSSNKIGMISFTDHNKINSQAYKYFVKHSNIAILPGIEIDVYLSEKANYSKHIIFYFDEKELDDIDSLKTIVEDYIDKNVKVIFEDFVMHLVSNDKHFAVSPHAFKQDKRGIDFDWFDEQSAKRGTNEFSGLIFPFWEASGKSDICKAIEFLREQYGTDLNRQAIIAFSDSADYKKLSDYIENPHQYFRCLNSFRGLLLAGSDPDRIVYMSEERPEKNPSEKISKIIFSDNLKPLKKENQIEIELSDRLNVIVGGRGKGKSALLDAIVVQMNENKIEERSRREFVKKFHMQIKNFNGSIMPSSTNFLYFSQSYIGKLFDGNSQEKLDSFFKKEFEHNDDVMKTVKDIRMIINKERKSISTIDNNIDDDFKNFNYVKQNVSNIQIKRKLEKHISLFDGVKSYTKAIREILPQDHEIWDDDLEKALSIFVEKLLSNICLFNFNRMIDARFSNEVKNKMHQINRIKSKENRKKVDSRNNIEEKLRDLYNREMKRMRQINGLYKVDKEITELRIKFFSSAGEGKNQFFFVSIIDQEHPVEYARRMIIDAVNKARQKGFSKQSFEDVFIKYAISDELEKSIKETSTFSGLIESIDTLKNIYTRKIQKIIYYNGNTYIDLHRTSPGMQTNAVMEYILHAESTVPLFIDQPEDNIDNEARYAQLTKWIRKQKFHRQIILVTHDANIVINGDAENVIIAEHTGEKFRYEYGALEYDNILDKAAIILDGGKTAIHRRIEKYGE